MFSCCVAPNVADVELAVQYGAEPKEREEVLAGQLSLPQQIQDPCTEDEEVMNVEDNKEDVVPKRFVSAVSIDEKHWQVIFKDEEANLRMEYLPSKHIPGGATYRARAVMEMPLSVEDALKCFMDFSKKKLNYARDYKDINVEKVLKHTGQLPGDLPEESIVTVWLNLSGLPWIVRPLFPVSMQLRLTVEEDASCAGQYHWMQESLGKDGRPDGRSKQGGSMKPHPSAPGKCMLASLCEVPSWFPLWFVKHASPHIKTYLTEYTERYLEYKKSTER